MGGVAPRGGKQQGPLFIPRLGFTTDNAAAASQNKAWVCQGSAGSRKAAPLLQKPRHSKGSQGSEGLRKGPGGAEKRQQAAPHGGGEKPSNATDLGHSPNAKAAAGAPAAPDNAPNSAWDPEESPLLRVTGQRTASGARPARAAVLADFALIGWTPMGWGWHGACAIWTNEKRRNTSGSLVNGRGGKAQAQQLLITICGEESSERSRWPWCNCRNATERACLLSTN